MVAPSNPIVLVPARMASTRLPGKPLADIHGEPMIVHVWRRAVEANIGPVAVACDDQAVFDAVTEAGGLAVMTGSDHESGSDRIYEALTKLDPEAKYDAIVNVQGDLPTVEPESVQAAYALLQNDQTDIGTLGAVISDHAEKTAPSVVKAIVEFDQAETQGQALYFTRATAPTGDGALVHHIGLYAYRREALEAFVKLKPGYLEQREKLEQLRALANGMRIDLKIVKEVPLGVDTQPDLERARKRLAP